jgi:hypothetical protein
MRDFILISSKTKAEMRENPPNKKSWLGTSLAAWAE